jgi:hypothetical protein
MQYVQDFAIIKRLSTPLILVGRRHYCSRSLAAKREVSEQSAYHILVPRRQGYPVQAIWLSATWAYQLPKQDAAPDLGARHRK